MPALNCSLLMETFCSSLWLLLLKEYYGQEMWSHFTHSGSERAVRIPVHKCLGLFWAMQSIHVLLESIPKQVNAVKQYRKLTFLLYTSHHVVLIHWLIWLLWSPAFLSSGSLISAPAQVHECAFQRGGLGGPIGSPVPGKPSPTRPPVPPHHEAEISMPTGMSPDLMLLSGI